jgi:plastocyanin
MVTRSSRSRFRRATACAAAAGLCLAAAAMPAAGAKAPVKITVKMTEYHFALSLKKVHTGTVVFTVVNKGQIPHTFEIQSLQKITPVIQPGDKALLRVTFKKPGSYYYLCTIGAHVQYGMAGTLKVVK